MYGEKDHVCKNSGSVGPHLKDQSQYFGLCDWLFLDDSFIILDLRIFKAHLNLHGRLL